MDHQIAKRKIMDDALEPKEFKPDKIDEY